MMTTILALGRTIVRGVDQFLADFGFVYIAGTQGSAAAREWQMKWDTGFQRPAFNDTTAAG
ncbi:MAG: hypothetical protein WAN71_00640 [Mycobacterium sp.]|uniref:hypothetical protein n=1 Tax=Mycobacterium sp. TaxID=1785 RepID=UPI003BAFE795